MGGCLHKTGTKRIFLSLAALHRKTTRPAKMRLTLQDKHLPMMTAEQVASVYVRCVSPADVPAVQV